MEARGQPGGRPHRTSIASTVMGAGQDRRTRNTGTDLDEKLIPDRFSARMDTPDRPEPDRPEPVRASP